MNSKLFISYSWSSEQHEAWVLDLATQLRESGVDVILDKWDLKEGHDAHAFMERMVTDSEIKKVALICDRVYSEKADGRLGGVGTETQIISPEIYAGADQSKFVAVIAERDETGKPYQPTYYKSRIHIDLSDANSYARNFEQLLRWVYDKPLHIKPELGKTPAFLGDKPGPTLHTSALAQRASDAIRNDRAYAAGAVDEYFQTFADNLENFRIAPDGQSGYDEHIVESIDQFLPFRNEAIELIQLMAQYRQHAILGPKFHQFIERLLVYQYRPEGDSAWQEFHASNFDFIVHEFFLYIIAILIKHQLFEATAYLFDNRYFVPNRDRNDQMVSFFQIRTYIEAFEHRKNRLKSNRISLRADLLFDRCKGIGISHSQFMQADFVAFIRADLAAGDDRHSRWWPETLLYLFRQRGPFEVFARAENQQVFRRLQTALGLTGLSIADAKSRLATYFEKIREGRVTLPRWEGHYFDPAELMSFEKLATT